MLGSLLLLTACSSGGADEVLAIEIESAPLTRDELINLTMTLAANGDFQGQEILIDDDLLRTVGTLHVRSTAIFDFLESQEEESFDINFLIDQADTAITGLVDSGQISALEDGSAELMARRYSILADRGSNPLRAETDPATGQSVVGDNPLTSSFVFDPNLRPNFDTVSPGFLEQFDETFNDFTQETLIAPDLGVWNLETFVIDAPA